MRRRNSSERFFGKLLFSAILMLATRLLEPVPGLRLVLDLVALAA